jgi:hypothetical protein
MVRVFDFDSAGQEKEAADLGDGSEGEINHWHRFSSMPKDMN